MTNTPKYCLKNGTIINNRYEIVRYISSGGFGITYEAHDNGFNNRVAIKELYIKEICSREADSLTVSINETNEPTFVIHRRKFIEEARRLHKLSHPNIVKVSDVIETNGTAYIVMEYIDGKPLSRVDVPLSETIARGYINSILDALEYVHNKGLLHLDIKPGNIMIDSSGKAILIDFGTSKVYGDSNGNSLSLSTSLAYTPGYAPLEQMSVKTVKDLGPYSDMYALGTTLYYILTGEKPLLPGEILENDGRLPHIESLSTEMQCAILQATKVVRTTRLTTVDQFRRALNGEIIDVKAEERRRKEEEERRRKEEEERRKKIATVPANTVIPKNNEETKPTNNGNNNNNNQTQTVATNRTTTYNEPLGNKPQKLNKAAITAILVALITIISLAGYRYIQNSINEDSVSTPTLYENKKKSSKVKQSSKKSNSKNKENTAEEDDEKSIVITTDNPVNQQSEVSNPASISTTDSAKGSINNAITPVNPPKTKVAKPKVSTAVKQTYTPQTIAKPAPTQNIIKATKTTNNTVSTKSTATPSNSSSRKKPKQTSSYSGGSAFKSSNISSQTQKTVNTDPFNKGTVKSDPFKKEQKVNDNPFKSKKVVNSYE